MRKNDDAAARWNLGKKRGGDGAPLDGSDVRGGGSDSSTPAPKRGRSQRSELNYRSDAVSEDDQESQPVESPRVIRRALVLAAVTCRGNIEFHPDAPPPAQPLIEIRLVDTGLPDSSGLIPRGSIKSSYVSRLPCHQ